MEGINYNMIDYAAEEIYQDPTDRWRILSNKSIFKRNICTNINVCMSGFIIIYLSMGLIVSLVMLCLGCMLIVFVTGLFHFTLMLMCAHIFDCIMVEKINLNEPLYAIKLNQDIRDADTIEKYLLLLTRISKRTLKTCGFISSENWDELNEIIISYNKIENTCNSGTISASTPLSQKYKNITNKAEELEERYRKIHIKIINDLPQPIYEEI